MKIVLIFTMAILTVFANESSWEEENSWDDSSQSDTNILYEKAKIENRANRVYDDKIYKYITGDYRVKNNQIEIGTVRLNDNLQNEDVKVSVYAENLDVEGNSYSDELDIKRNEYKNYVNNDESRLHRSNDSVLQGYNPDYDNSQYDDFSKDKIMGSVSHENSRYSKVKDPYISEIGEIDLRKERDIKEVNVLIEDVNILVE